MAVTFDLPTVSIPIDPKLAAIVESIWQPCEIDVDEDVVPPQILANGTLRRNWPERIQFESALERLVMAVLVVCRAGRVTSDTEVPLKLDVTVEGRIVGDVGMHYFEETELEHVMNR
jgi:hypothetical protein